MSKESNLCIIGDCSKARYHRGLCQMHAWRLKTYNNVFHKRKSILKCTAAGCDSDSHGRSLCSIHRGRLKRNGSFDISPRPLLAAHRYRQIKRPGHPLANPITGRVYTHRASLFESIGFAPVPCFWCGARIKFSRVKTPFPEDALLVDHLDHDRHNNDNKNLVPSCHRCNSSRVHWRKVKMVSVYSAG